MNEKTIEMKLEDKILRIEETARFCVAVLEILCDEGSTITTDKSDSVLCGMSEKLELVINELIAMKKDVDLIESVEKLLSDEQE